VCTTYVTPLTPDNVCAQKGAFGGTYFRKIKSGVTGETYSDAWKEFPDAWFEGMQVKTQVASATYHESRNKYGVKCGSGLDAWEEKGWIEPSAPFGWFHWYCRYFMGLRGEDDQRQISRWNKCAGLKSGRWVRNLVTKVCRAQASYDDEKVSPVVRQTLLHWGYELTDEDFLQIARSRGMLSDEESGNADSPESEDTGAQQKSGGTKRSRAQAANGSGSNKQSKKE